MHQRLFCCFAKNIVQYMNMIEINNLSDFTVDKKFFLGVAKKVLKGENKELESLSIAFVSIKEIRKVNKKYRKKDKTTDVLSFEKKGDFKEDFLEVVICPQIVREKTLNSDLNFKQELAKALIHGILHSIGYDHERSAIDADIMENREKYYFEKSEARSRSLKL